MLRFGDQYVSPATRPGEFPEGSSGIGSWRWASRYWARASVEIASATRWTRSTFPHRAKPYGFREDRGASACHAVQRLVPPVIDRYPETRNRGSAVLHLQHLIFQRHAGHYIRRALFRRQLRILIGKVAGLFAELPRRLPLTTGPFRKCLCCL